MNERPIKISSFRDLDIWKLGKDIVKDIYDVTQAYPKREVFSLTSQMRRSALSIPTNVAEGFNRYHNREYRQFLFIALGSCAELETHLEISKDLGFISPEKCFTVLEKLNYESRMIRNMVKKLV